MKRSKAFTLIEVLVAITIFAFIGVAAYSALNTVIQSDEALEEKTQRFLSVQRSMQRFYLDLQQLAQRAIRDQFGDQQPFLVGLSDDDGRQAVIEFTRLGWENPAELPRSSLQRVRYQFDREQLSRSTWTFLDRSPQVEPLQQPLLSNVEQVRFAFLSKGEWHSRWPLDNRTESKVLLPDAVSFKIVTKDYGEIERIIVVGSMEESDGT